MIIYMIYYMISYMIIEVSVEISTCAALHRVAAAKAKAKWATSTAEPVMVCSTTSSRALEPRAATFISLLL